MKMTPAKISGVFVVELEKREDERGFLARSFDKGFFLQYGIHFDPVEGYTCFSKRRGTIRGFHFLAPPHKEIKLTRVTRGSLFEVVLDIRPDSPTYRKSLGYTFSDTDYSMLLIPSGCAHAVLTLSDDTEYCSLYAPVYEPSIERGIRWNDPAFAIKWPIPVEHISAKDNSWPDYNL